MTEASCFIISNKNISFKNVLVSSDYHHQFYNCKKKLWKSIICSYKKIKNDNSNFHVYCYTFVSIDIR